MIEQTRLAGRGETRLLRDPISHVGIAIIQVVHLSTIRTSLPASEDRIEVREVDCVRY